MTIRELISDNRRQAAKYMLASIFLAVLAVLAWRTGCRWFSGGLALGFVVCQGVAQYFRDEARDLKERYIVRR